MQVTPRDGLPSVVDTPQAFAALVDDLAAASGPVALDTERAQSYRYSARAYLIQIRREGVGTRLIDPIALQTGPEPADLSVLTGVLADTEWVLHAASQDLPCLVEVGMVPGRLYDTELAGRLLGYPRVSLGTLLERVLDIRLLKEHSAADWSMRPLPDALLAYAALDVDFLIELRDAMDERLREVGKDDWARQEFAWLAVQDWTTPTDDPSRWRRMHGLSHIRSRRGLAVAHQLWLARDAIARARDLAPGRVLKDAAIIELACQVGQVNPIRMGTVAGFHRRVARQQENDWRAAIDRAMSAPDHRLPPLRMPRTEPPPPRTWQRSQPEAWDRWTSIRPLIVKLSEQIDVPAENLIPPHALRRLAWEPPAQVDEGSITAMLEGAGARPWQCELVTPVIVPALTALLTRAPERTTA